MSRRSMMHAVLAAAGLLGFSVAGGAGAQDKGLTFEEVVGEALKEFEMPHAVSSHRIAPVESNSAWCGLAGESQATK